MSGLSSEHGNDWPVPPISAISCTAPQQPMCRSWTARRNPGKLGPHRPHYTPSPAEDPAAKMACFNCGILRHIAKVCQKPRTGSTNRSVASSTRKESCIFAARVYTRGPKRRTGWFSKRNRKSKTNTWATPASPMTSTSHKWFERDETHLWELELASQQMVSMEKTMHWWSDYRQQVGKMEQGTQQSE